jgi:hypothetical protein
VPLRNGTRSVPDTFRSPYFSASPEVLGSGHVMLLGFRGVEWDRGRRGNI